MSGGHWTKVIVISSSCLCSHIFGKSLDGFVVEEIAQFLTRKGMTRSSYDIYKMSVFLALDNVKGVHVQSADGGCCNIDKSRWKIDPKFSLEEDLSMLINPYLDRAKCFVQTLEDVELLYCSKDGKSSGTKDDGTEIALLKNKKTGCYAYYYYTRTDWNSYKYHDSTYKYVRSNKPSLHDLCACALAQSIKTTRNSYYDSSLLEHLRKIGVVCEETEKEWGQLKVRSKLEKFEKTKVDMFEFDHGVYRYLPCYFVETSHTRGYYVKVKTTMWKNDVQTHFKLGN